MSKMSNRDPLSQFYDEGLKAFRSLEKMQTGCLEAIGQAQLALLEGYVRFLNRQIEAMGKERPLPELYEDTARDWLELGSTLTGNLRSMVEHATALQNYDVWGGLLRDLHRESSGKAA